MTKKERSAKIVQFSAATFLQIQLEIHNWVKNNDIAGLQPFPRELNDKDPGGHVGWQEQ